MGEAEPELHAAAVGEHAAEDGGNGPPAGPAVPAAAAERPRLSTSRSWFIATVLTGAAESLPLLLPARIYVSVANSFIRSVGVPSQPNVKS